MTMKLFWAGLIFGAGYVLGRPEGRAKLAELSKRPEVTQLRQRAVSTVSSGAKTGRQQLANAAHTVKDKASEKLPNRTSSGSGAVTEPAAVRRGLRLPSFPPSRRPSRHVNHPARRTGRDGDRNRGKRHVPQLCVGERGPGDTLAASRDTPDERR
jgi:hypothetical protein